MSAEDDDSPPQRKGRGNAILTYEKVETLLVTTREVSLKLDHILSDVVAQRADHGNLERRVHALELSEARNTAGQAAGKNTALWINSAVQSAIMTVLAILTYLNK